MRRIKLLVGVSGASFSWRAGQEVPLPDEEAEKWADGKRAVFVDEEDVEEPETDEEEPEAEEAPAPRTRRRRRKSGRRK